MLLNISQIYILFFILAREGEGMLSDYRQSPCTFKRLMLCSICEYKQSVASLNLIQLARWSEMISKQIIVFFSGENFHSCRWFAIFATDWVKWPLTLHPKQGKSVMAKNVAKYKIINSRLTSTISISMVLFLLGLISMFAYIGDSLSKHIKENLTITVELRDFATPEETQALGDSLKGLPCAKSLIFTSKEAALEQLREEMGEDPMRLISHNPLLDTYDIYLNSSYANNDSILFIAKSLRGLPIVNKVDYQKNLIHELNYNLTRVSAVFLFIAVTLLLISFVLINNTMRLLIYSNRFIINTMKLVGATKWFIRRPYLWQGILIGFGAAVLAMLYMLAFFYFSYPNISLYINLNDMNLYVVIATTILASGIIITALATLFATNKYLRHETNDLYFI